MSSAPDAAAAARRDTGWLAATLLAALVVWAILAWVFRIPRWLPTPRASIGTVTHRSLGGGASLAVAGVALYSAYIAGALRLWRLPATPRIRALVWGGAGVAGLLLLWSYPVTSTDVFDYFFRSLKLVREGANPYLVLPNAFKGDRFLRYIGWPNAPSAYGPLWEILSAALVAVARGSLFGSLLLYKLLALVTHLVCGALIGKLVDEPRLRTLSVYLWLLSPLALWEQVAVGHNDGLMVLSLLLALLAVRREHHGLAVLALLAGALVKFLPALFVPLVVIDWMRRQRSWRLRLGVAATALLLCGLPTIILYAPFWDLPPGFGALRLAEQLAAIWRGGTTTLHNLTVREGFLNASPLALLSYVLQSGPSLAALNDGLAALALPLADKNDVRRVISAVGSVLTVCGLLWQSWHIWYRRRALQPAMLGLLLWYVLAGSQWFQPWYLAWLLALLVIGPSRAGWLWLTLWALAAQGSYLLQFLVLPAYKIGGQTLLAQSYYLAAIYALPALAWLWLVLRARRATRTRDGAGAAQPAPR